MSETLPPPLPPDLSVLLAAERARADLPDAAKERILERLEARVAVPWMPRGLATALGTFACGLVLGAALCGVWLSGRAGALQPKVLVLDPPLPPAPVVVVLRTAAPPAQPPSPPAPGRSDGAGAEHDRELARERALLETARTALARKPPDPAEAADAPERPDAITLLLQHARQFPDGRLAEERESLLIQALAAAGRTSEARSRAARFRTRFSHSLLLPAVEAAALGADARPTP